jgi:hypothetical protein
MLGMTVRPKQAVKGGGGNPGGRAGKAGKVEGPPEEWKRHAAVYPWEEWFAGRQFVLRHGQDFHCSLSGMTTNIRQAARRHGVRVRVDQGWDHLTVTVKKDDE